MNFKKKLGGLAVAAALVASAPSHALMDFDVDETPYGGGIVTADKLNGGYQEKITFTDLGGGLQSFVTNAFATFGLLFSDDGTQPVSGIELNNSYSLYAVFSSAGIADTTGPLAVFSGAVGSFELFLDVNIDTVATLGATGADPIALVGTADDLLLGTSTNLVAGGGVLVPNFGGFFDLTFDDIVLTGDGMNYFVDPDPFYVRAVVDGDFDDFIVAGTQTVIGDVSVVFVPEPATLMLFGAGVAGLGFSARRKRKVA